MLIDFGSLCFLFAILLAEKTLSKGKPATMTIRNDMLVQQVALSQNHLAIARDRLFRLGQLRNVELKQLLSFIQRLQNLLTFPTSNASDSDINSPLWFASSKFSLPKRLEDTKISLAVVRDACSSLEALLNEFSLELSAIIKERDRRLMELNYYPEESNIKRNLFTWFFRVVNSEDSTAEDALAKLRGLLLQRDS